MLDIARSPEGQGFAEGSVDVLVAANVLHATPRLRETLAHAATLLAPDGQLLLIENSGTLPWGDLTFGLQPMGCGASPTPICDPDMRCHHRRPGRALLQEGKLRGIAPKQPGDARTAMLSGQFALLARRRSVAADRVWIAPADGDAVAVLDAALTEVRAAVAEPIPPRLWLVTRGGRAAYPAESTILSRQRSGAWPTVLPSSTLNCS